MTVVLFEFIYLFYFAVEKMVQIGKEVLEKQSADLNDVRYVDLEQTCNAVFVMVLCINLSVKHTGYPETINATENNKRC